MSQIPPLPGANIRSHAYFVARTRVRCPYCGLPTGLLAVAVPHDHEVLHEDVRDDADERAEPSAEVWQRAGVNAFVFYVHHLSDGARDQLNRLSQSFRPAHCAATMNTHWVNHCERCGRPLGDHELHCEPGVFMPSSEAAAANIELVRIQEPFAAVAAGYAVDPEFFAFMRKG
jgi:ribosomal protein S14